MFEENNKKTVKYLTNYYKRLIKETINKNIVKYINDYCKHFLERNSS